MPVLLNMSEHLKWGERKFAFTFPVQVFPEMIERVRGTPARLEDRVKSIQKEMLTRRDGERWSIQENAGHLLDIEALFSRRLDEYLAGAETLHAANMSNRKTFEADHNRVNIQSLLTGFRRERTRLVQRFEDLSPDTFAKVAHHPRLDVPMRLVDMIFFQVEHDDYHLARISELARLFMTKGETTGASPPSQP
jgi:uncharacterized damage-inducible protein DinB